MRKYLLGLAMLAPLSAAAQSYVPKTAAGVPAPISKGTLWTPSMWQDWDAHKVTTTNGSLATPTITGGTASGTDVRNAVLGSLAPVGAAPSYTVGAELPLGSTVGYTQSADKDVFIGAIAGLYEAGTPSNTANLRATGRAGLMATTLGLYRLLYGTSNPADTQWGGSLAYGQAVVNTFVGTGGGILEGNIDGATTPGLPQYRISLGTADGSTKSFSVSAANALSPSSVQIISGTGVVSTDDGNGNLTGSAGTGTVNYSSGAITFTFKTAPASGTNLSAGFNWPGTFSKSATLPSGYQMIWNYDRTDTWKPWIDSISWHPSIFLMNLSSHGTSSLDFSPQDVADQVVATANIKSIDPDIKYVIPYLSPNSGVYSTWATDPYWTGSRALAIQQGGMAIDIPVGLFLRGTAAYRQVIYDQIKWAQQNGLISYVLLSPCSTNDADWTVIGACQFSPDPHFMSSSQEVIRQIHNAGYDPTGWIVDNYSEQAVSPQIGTDNTADVAYSPNTIAAIGRWVAENAPTSPYPTTMAGVESAGPVVASPQITAGRATTTPTVGMLRGLGSMAYTNSDNVSILGGNITGIVNLGATTATIAGALNVNSNIGMVSGNSLIFNSEQLKAKQTPVSYVYETTDGILHFTNFTSILMPATTLKMASFDAAQASRFEDNAVLASGKALVMEVPNTGGCYFFHDNSAGGLVWSCNGTRLMRIPDDGSAPVFRTAPAAGTP